jgi:F0F1-type ATP synthase assembly protein I
MIKIAYEFVLSIIIWFIIGYLFSYYYDNNIYIVIGFFIGLFMGFLKFVKMIKNKNREKDIDK